MCMIWKKITQNEMKCSLFWRSFLFGVFFGQIGGNLGKHPSHPQKFACSYTYASGYSFFCHFTLKPWFLTLLTSAKSFCGSRSGIDGVLNRLAKPGVRVELQTSPGFFYTWVGSSSNTLDYKMFKIQISWDGLAGNMNCPGQ